MAGTRPSRGWLMGLAVGIALVAALFASMAVRAYQAVGALGADGRGPYVDDPRACGRSNVPLREVARAFDFVVPRDADDVRFHSDLHPLFGEYHLRLSFRTTPHGLQEFVSRSGLPTPRPLAGKRPDLVAGLGSCPREPDGRRRLLTASRTWNDGRKLVVLIGRDNGQRRLVLVRGWTL